MAAKASDSQVWRASTTAPVNIAVIKYWGKRDAHLNLPSNSSISVTLSQRDLRTHTTASCSSKYAQDALVLNDLVQDISGRRTQVCLRELRNLREQLELSEPSLPRLSALPLHIVTTNNFPTAAGLASSAAGFAALVRAIADLYALPQSPETLSLIARQGSGSACRSLLGGYVAWNMGSEMDGSDSCAEQVASASYWPTMRALIVVVSAAQKAVSSTTGMATSAATSDSFPNRALKVVPARMEAMRMAVKARDFPAFAMLTMRDSNSFHATCMDTWPPIVYLTDVSWCAVKVVQAINAANEKLVAAYTFDAGPNCVVYYEEKDSALVEGCFRGILGSVSGWENCKTQPEGGADVKIDGIVKEKLMKGTTRVILTGVGEGPISVDDHLIDESGEKLKR